MVAAGNGAGASADPPRIQGLPTEQQVADLVRLAGQAHEALMRGDLPRYRSLLAFSDDFMLMTPFGGKPTHGTPRKEDQWDAIGRFFRNGRNSTVELVQAYRAIDLVVLGLIERSHVEVGGLPAQDWVLRVTLVFRREGDRWLLAHRHADGLAGGISLSQAASLAAASLS